MKTILVFLFALLTVTVYGQANPTSHSLGKVILNNEKVKVTEFESQPNKDICGLGMHTHPAHLTILLTEATVTVTLPNGKTFTQKQPAGTTFWSEAETHTVINSGKGVAKAQIIEYKKK
ncbi:MAG: hypothetical protein JST43_03300 [Bacteroidetes bacterium]|nr:hypothetical protein [Bacteroidota bacterium]MBS1540247.1 hypothetical protein [Bacteroidota bacterium]